MQMHTRGPILAWHIDTREIRSLIVDAGTRRCIDGKSRQLVSVVHSIDYGTVRQSIVHRSSSVPDLWHLWQAKSAQPRGRGILNAGTPAVPVLQQASTLIFVCLVQLEKAWMVEA